jgi:hypothetical protein
MTDIRTEVKNTTDELIRVLSSFSQAELNTAPSEDSWTGAQVGQHLLKSYGVVEILNKPVRKTERPADQKIDAIKKVMLNFDTKMNAPEFILPEKTQIDKETLLNSLRNITARIVDISEPLDLSETCLGFAIPNFGEFTRLEWLHFILYHTQRHIKQLKNIQQKVMGGKEKVQG